MNVTSLVSYFLDEGISYKVCSYFFGFRSLGSNPFIIAVVPSTVDFQRKIVEKYKLVAGEQSPPPYLQPPR